MRKTTKKKKTVNEEAVHLNIWDVFGIVLRTVKIIINFFAILAFAAVVFGVGVGMGYVASLFDKVNPPSQKELVAKVTELSKISRVVYADNSFISDVSSDLLRTPVSSKKISDHVKNAVIATEDANFKSHRGVVPKAVLRAAIGSAGIGNSSGGSTLTQQLIKQQYVGDAPTFDRKVNEIVSALALERSMSKDEILTTYLNVSPFGFNNNGKNIAGIEEAAQGIFGVSASKLNVPQAAFIAGLPQSPVSYSPYDGNGRLKSRDEMKNWGLARYEDVLYNMYRAGYLKEDDYKKYGKYDVYKDFKKSGATSTDKKDYLYYAIMDEAEEDMYQYLLKRDKISDTDLKNDETVQAYRALAQQELSQGGYTVHSTIDKKIYKAMQKAVVQYGPLLNDQSGAAETGSVLMDNNTGAILGFIGGRNYANNQNNHALASRRNPGSTVKPYLVYGVALDQGLIGSGTMMSDYPTSFADGTPIMHAEDAGSGLVTFQRALNISANIPAFWTYKMLQNAGIDVKTYMDKMHYPLPNMYNIESLPMGGGIDVTVAENVNAYQTLANGGVYQEKHIVDSITDSNGKTVYKHKSEPVQVYSPAAASIMIHMLREVLSSNATTTFNRTMEGLNPSLAQNKNIVGKTGTSNAYADVWLMIISPRVTLGTWTGHDDNTSMNNRSGYINNSQYVANLVNTLNQTDASLFNEGSFKLDSSVISSNVLASTGTKPGTFQKDGRTYSLSGSTTTSYWAKNGAPNLSYDFMVGGTASDKAKAWSSVMGSVANSNAKSSNATDKKDEKKEEKLSASSSQKKDD